MHYIVYSKPNFQASTWTICPFHTLPEAKHPVSNQAKVK